MIDVITHTNDKSRTKLIRKLANLPLKNQLQVFKLSLNYMYKFKDKYSTLSNVESYYCSFIEAIYQDTKEIKFNRNDIENELKKLKKQEIIKVKKIQQKHKRKSTVKDKLMSKKYWIIVEKLRRVDKLSFKATADYLYTYHKFKVNYTYIAKAWKEVHNEH